MKLVRFFGKYLRHYAGWAAIEVITDEKIERELIPRLKRAGATGLVSYPLSKVIP